MARATGMPRPAKLALAVVLLVAAGAVLYHRYAPRRVPEGQASLGYLGPARLDDLREAFNDASDRKRLLLLLSPTCSVCLRGASAVQDILRSASDPLAVFVVWEPVIRTDLAPPTNGTLSRISDSRARQYWDNDLSLSSYLVSVARANPSWVRPGDRERVIDEGVIVWDVALVFPAGPVWDSSLPQPSFYGGPIVDEVGMIRAALVDR